MAEGTAQSSHLGPKAHWEWKISWSLKPHPSDNKVTLPNLSQQFHQLGDQVCKHMNLWGPFPFNPPHVNSKWRESLVLERILFKESYFRDREIAQQIKQNIFYATLIMWVQYTGSHSGKRELAPQSWSLTSTCTVIHTYTHHAPTHTPTCVCTINNWFNIKILRIK